MTIERKLVVAEYEADESGKSEDGICSSWPSGHGAPFTIQSVAMSRNAPTTRRRLSVPEPMAPGAVKKLALIAQQAVPSAANSPAKRRSSGG